MKVTWTREVAVETEVVRSVMYFRGGVDSTWRLVWEVGWKWEREREESMMTPRFGLGAWVTKAPSTEIRTIPEEARHD